MNSNRKLFGIAVVAILVGAMMTDAMAVETSAGPKPVTKPKIQVALLLDTSSSMSGLISQAKSQLWKVINEFIMAKRNGQRPEMQVALYEYGKSTLSRGEGFIRQILPLTDDLDKVSEELFALKTNGGDEYCGQVIQVATGSLQWSSSSKDLKAIFIAGNEPFTQGKVNYADACRAAIAKGITVSTIFCGPEATGIQGKWKDGAMLADGSYMNIDHNRRVVHIAAPQDKRIAELGAALNGTYLPFGTAGKAGAANQFAQDANSASVGAGSSVQRAVSKSSGYYRNDSWDLVDAIENGKVKLEDVKKEDLPKAMQKMNLEEQRKYIETNSAKRAQLKKEIAELNKERRKHVAAEEKKSAAEGKESLDSAMAKSLRRQATEKGFEIKE